MPTDNRNEFAESVKKYLFHRRMYESAHAQCDKFKAASGVPILAVTLAICSLTIPITLLSEERLSGISRGQITASFLLLLISIGVLTYDFWKVQTCQNKRVEEGIRLLFSVIRMTSFRNDIAWNVSYDNSYYPSVYAYRRTQPLAPNGDEQKENAVFKAMCTYDRGGYFLDMSSHYDPQSMDIKDAYYDLDRLDDIKAGICEAAEHGPPDVQYLCGRLEKDKAVAAQWMRRAADAGHWKAQRTLGAWAEAGYGVPQNLVFAYAWFHRVGGKEDLDRVAAKMTPEQIAEAKKLIRKLDAPK